MLLGPAAAVTPPAQDLIHSSFYAGEQPARSLSSFLLEVIVAIWVVAIEWLARWALVRRRICIQRANTTTE
jgi:hypothetical protein